jgi:hypothetical protein
MGYIVYAGMSHLTPAVSAGRNKEKTMCVVSMVIDHYTDEWDRRRYPPSTSPIWPPQQYEPWPLLEPYPAPTVTPQEIEEFKRLLDRAREYDRKNNEPDCELEDKRKKLKDLAKELGVEIDFV